MKSKKPKVWLSDSGFNGYIYSRAAQSIAWTSGRRGGGGGKEVLLSGPHFVPC